MDTRPLFLVYPNFFMFKQLPNSLFGLKCVRGGSTRASGTRHGRKLLKGREFVNESKQEGLQRRQHPAWSTEDDALMGTMPDDELARRLGRTLIAVKARRSIKGISSPWHKPVRKWDERNRFFGDKTGPGRRLGAWPHCGICELEASDPAHPWPRAALATALDRGSRPLARDDGRRVARKKTSAHGRRGRAAAQ
jgi:hypothetical protein